MVRTFFAAMFALCVVPFAACSGDPADLNEEEEAPVDGKLDSFRRPTDNGNLLFGEAAEAEITTDAKFHVWTFELSGPAITSIESGKPTPTSPAVDTILYLYRQNDVGGWGSYIERDDDSGTDEGSALNLPLREGTYRILVKGKRASTRGEVAVQVLCSGVGCRPVASPTSPTCTFDRGFRARGAYLGAIEEGTLQGFETLAPDDLPAEPRRLYERWLRDGRGEYEPIVYDVPLEDGGSVIAIEQGLERHMRAEIFDADGFHLGQGGTTEFTEFEWGVDPCWQRSIQSRIDAYLTSAGAMEGIRVLEPRQMPEHSQGDVEHMLALYTGASSISYLQIHDDDYPAFAMVASFDGVAYVRLFDEDGDAIAMAYPSEGQPRWTTDLRLDPVE